MGVNAEPRKGPVEGASRILRELLRTPDFKKTVKILVNDLDPENAGLLVRTLIWEDLEFFLGLFGALPSIVDTGVVAARELARQLLSFPPSLLAGFLKGTVEGIDAEAAGEAAGRLLLLLARLNGLEDAGLRGSTSAFWRGAGRGLATALTGETDGGGPAESLLAPLLSILRYQVEKAGKAASDPGSETSKFVAGLVDGIRELARDNPEFMRNFVAPLLEAGRDALEIPGTGGRD